MRVSWDVHRLPNVHSFHTSFHVARLRARIIRGGERFVLTCVPCTLGVRIAVPDVRCHRSFFCLQAIKAINDKIFKDDR